MIRLETGCARGSDLCAALSFRATLRQDVLLGRFGRCRTLFGSLISDEFATDCASAPEYMSSGALRQRSDAPGAWFLEKMSARKNGIGCLQARL